MQIFLPKKIVLLFFFCFFSVLSIAQFIVQYAKAMCMGVVMRGSPIVDKEMAMAENMKKDMVDALTNRTPDNNDKIPLDNSNYWEHS